MKFVSEQHPGFRSFLSNFVETLGIWGLGCSTPPFHGLAENPAERMDDACSFWGLRVWGLECRAQPQTSSLWGLELKDV